MKRFIVIILSVICILGLVICGNSVKSASDTQVSGTKDVNTEENDISDTIKEDSEKQQSPVDVNTTQ